MSEYDDVNSESSNLRWLMVSLRSTSASRRFIFLTSFANRQLRKENEKTHSYSFSSGYGLVAGPCEHGKEFSDSIKGVDVSISWADYPLNKGSAENVQSTDNELIPASECESCGNARFRKRK
jgi:hypothetical protein